MAMIHTHIMPLVLSDGQYNHLERAIRDKLDVLDRRGLKNSNEYKNLGEAMFRLRKARQIAAEAESRGKVIAFREVDSTKLQERSKP